MSGRLLPQHRVPGHATRRSGHLRATGALLVAMVACNAMAAADSPCPARPGFSSMRYEEDWSALRDPRCRSHWLDPLKAVPLAGDALLTLGGDARVRYERFDNPGFGAGVPDDDGYWLQRTLAHADLRLTPSLRAFGQLESSRIDGRNGGPRPTDENRGDVNQAFVEWLPVRRDADRLAVRLGRQEVELGSAQFTSARDGLNDRLSFDGVRVVGEVGGWLVHAMATRVVPTVPGSFDDRTRPGETLSGFYLGRRHELLPGGTGVLYVNRRSRDGARYADAAGREERLTAGMRWFGRGEHWDYSFEGGIQAGSVGSSAIRVWYVNTDNGWTFAGTPGRPRAGVRFSVGSGDHRPGDGELGTFSPLFAATAYSGLAGQVGPSNSINIAPSVSVRVHEDVVLTAGTSVFWRQSLDDGVYGIGSDLLRAPGRSNARLVGTQPTLQASWFATRNVTVFTTLSWFRAGPFLRETPPGDDVTYFTAWWAYRF